MAYRIFPSCSLQFLNYISSSKIALKVFSTEVICLELKAQSYFDTAYSLVIKIVIISGEFMHIHRICLQKHLQIQNENHIPLGMSSIHSYIF